MQHHIFKRNKNRLIRYAKKNQLDVRFILDDDAISNVYIHKTVRRKAKILIKSKQSLSRKICVLLHEMGHFRDYQKHPERYSYYSQAYNSPDWYNGKTITQEVKKILMLAEKRAWREAEELAYELNIKLGKWFFQNKERALDTYRNREVKDK